MSHPLIFLLPAYVALEKRVKKMEQVLIERRLKIERLKRDKKLTIWSTGYSSVAGGLGILPYRKVQLRKALTATIMKQHHAGKSINVLELFKEMEGVGQTESERAYLYYQIGRASLGIMMATPKQSTPQTEKTCNGTIMHSEQSF